MLCARMLCESPILLAAAFRIPIVFKGPSMVYGFSRGYKNGRTLPDQ
jgi:hypothetical protein